MKKLTSVIFFISLFSLLQGCSNNLLSDQRTMTQQFDDNALSHAALNKVRELNIDSANLRINFTSNSNYLLVLGQVTNQKNKDAINAKLNTLQQAKGIYNQLRIGKPIDLAQQGKDSWITAQIKSKFAANDMINPFQIKVITENLEVFLIGKIDRKRASIATEIARNTAAVKNVNQVFQLVD